MEQALNLGEYIKHLRRRRGWRLQELAVKAGVTVSHISRIENGRVFPSASTVISLGKALDGDLGRMVEEWWRMKQEREGR